MKKVCFLFCITLCLFFCSGKLSSQEYPVINVANSAGKYQRVYCSDLFSSIDIIPLETTDDCLMAGINFRIACNDSLIFIRDIITTSTASFWGIPLQSLYAFDFSGKFRNEIGKKGQSSAEYTEISDFFLKTDGPAIYVCDYRKIVEYDFKGKFIRSFQKPVLDNNPLTKTSYIGDNLFIGQTDYDGKKSFKYCIFDQDGEIVKTYPHHIFDRVNSGRVWAGGSLYPAKMDNRVYLKDYYSDTLYVLENLALQPAYVFSFGKYSLPRFVYYIQQQQSPAANYVVINDILGTPNFFFYLVQVPNSWSKPKAKQEYSRAFDRYFPTDHRIYGLYDIARKTNILLDTDRHFQKGIVNDLNGGLPFIPRYYAGNNIVVDLWSVTDMQEMLTDDYFAKQTVKDPQAHQKLKEILKNLKYDDNPVVVVAKLK